MINRLRFLEIQALLALAHRLAGNSGVANHLADQSHENLEATFHELEPKIKQYLQTANIKSELIAYNLRETVFPRVDLVATALVIQVEEAIARGNQEKLIVQDLVLERLMELDNILRILGEMTPKDDTIFFAAHFRAS